MPASPTGSPRSPGSPKRNSVMKRFSVSLVGKPERRSSSNGNDKKKEKVKTTNLGMADLKRDIWSNLQQIQDLHDRKVMKEKYDNYVQTEKYMLRLPQGKYEKCLWALRRATAEIVRNEARDRTVGRRKERKTRFVRNVLCNSISGVFTICLGTADVALTITQCVLFALRGHYERATVLVFVLCLPTYMHVLYDLRLLRMWNRTRDPMGFREATLMLASKLLNVHLCLGKPKYQTAHTQLKLYYRSRLWDVYCRTVPTLALMAVSIFLEQDNILQTDSTLAWLYHSTAFVAFAYTTWVLANCDAVFTVHFYRLTTCQFGMLLSCYTLGLAFRLGLVSLAIWLNLDIMLMLLVFSFAVRTSSVIYNICRVERRVKELNLDHLGAGLGTLGRRASMADSPAGSPRGGGSSVLNPGGGGNKVAPMPPPNDDKKRAAAESPTNLLGIPKEGFELLTDGKVTSSDGEAQPGQGGRRGKGRVLDTPAKSNKVERYTTVLWNFGYITLYPAFFLDVLPFPSPLNIGRSTDPYRASLLVDAGHDPMKAHDAAADKMISHVHAILRYGHIDFVVLSLMWGVNEIFFRNVLSADEVGREGKGLYGREVPGLDKGNATYALTRGYFPGWRNRYYENADVGRMYGCVLSLLFLRFVLTSAFYVPMLSRELDADELEDAREETTTQRVAREEKEAAQIEERMNQWLSNKVEYDEFGDPVDKAPEEDKKRKENERLERQERTRKEQEETGRQKKEALLRSKPNFARPTSAAGSRQIAVIPGGDGGGGGKGRIGHPAGEGNGGFKPNMSVSRPDGKGGTTLLMLGAADLAIIPAGDGSSSKDFVHGGGSDLLERRSAAAARLPPLLSINVSGAGGPGGGGTQDLTLPSDEEAARLAAKRARIKERRAEKAAKRTEAELQAMAKEMRTRHLLTLCGKCMESTWKWIKEAFHRNLFSIIIVPLTTIVAFVPMSFVPKVVVNQAAGGGAFPNRFGVQGGWGGTPTTSAGLPLPGRPPLPVRTVDIGPDPDMSLQPELWVVYVTFIPQWLDCALLAVMLVANGTLFTHLASLKPKKRQPPVAIRLHFFMVAVLIVRMHFFIINDDLLVDIGAMNRTYFATWGEPGSEARQQFN